MKVKRFLGGMAENIVVVLSLMIALFVTIISYVYYIDITDMSWCMDKPLFLLLFSLGVSILVNFILGRIGSRENSGKRNKILFGTVFVVIMSATAWWIINAQSLAQNDLKSLHDIAIRIVQEHDLSMIANKDSYMALYPFQSGMLLYYEMILHVIPGLNVVPMQGLNWLYLALGLVSGYFLVKKWFVDEKVTTWYLLLLLFCWPWFFYVNFAYGEMPSICFLLFTLWMLTIYFENAKRRYLCGALLANLVAVLLRKNHVIFVIAMVLVLLVLCIQKYQKEYLFTLAGLVVVTAIASICPQKIYELRAGNSMGKGIPATAYLAMGLQETEGISPGWNNGYHTTTFIDNDYDTETTDRLSKESISASLSYMWENPQYAGDFYFRKLVPEWCDQNYSCLYSTSMVYYNRTDAAHNIYNGSRTEPIMKIMNVYQSFLYTGFLLFCIQAVIRKIKQKTYFAKMGLEGREIWSLVLAVSIIGGFLFCAIWEGGSRYTLPYMVCMLPYAAAGIARLNWPCVKKDDR